MKTTSSFLFAVLFFCSLIWMGQACQNKAGSQQTTDVETAWKEPPPPPLMGDTYASPAEAPELKEIDPTAPGENHKDYGENSFTNTLQQPVSTFAIDADGASYANCRRFLDHEQLPPPAAIRIEELINYFPFDLPPSHVISRSHPLQLDGEISDCPWASEHKLLRLGVKGKHIAKELLPACNFVFLVDVSGSMSDPGKLDLLKDAFVLFAEKLRPQDRVALVTYAGEAGVALESTSGKEFSTIRNAIRHLDSGGSTNGEGGIHKAYEIAVKNFIQGGNNRVVLATDGDFNVGVSSEEELVKLIEYKRNTGVFLTVLGVGTGNYQDAQMEQLANHGNGTYEYLDNLDQAQKVFVDEFGKLFTVAQDVKIQLHFNPKLVKEYRLVGYENRMLEQEEFFDNTKDAGEIGADQCITALYEIVPVRKPQTWNEKMRSLAWLTGVKPKQPLDANAALRIDCRYKNPGEKESIPLALDLLAQTTKFAEASENQHFAAAVAGYGMLLKGSKNKGDLTWKQVRRWAEGAKSFDPGGWRKEFLQWAEKAEKLQETGLFSNR